MENIKILKRIIISIFIIVLLWFFADTILTILALLLEKDILHFGHFNDGSIPMSLKLLTILKSITFAVFIYASYFLIKILLLKNTIDYLSNEASKLLKKSGILIILSNGISFILSFAIFFIDIKYFVYFNTGSRSLYLLMLVFGLFLIIFSKVIKIAKELKQENELTI
jgi:hypothetical protein